MTEKPDTIWINNHLDIRMINNEATIFVDDKEFKQCSFLLINLPENDPRINTIDSIDELANQKETRMFEGHKAYSSLGMTPHEILQAHASNIIAWVENDYDTRILHSNLSFPLLKALANAGDVKAKRVLHGEIHDRIRTGVTSVQLSILLTCYDVIDEENCLYLARHGTEDVKLELIGIKPPLSVLSLLAGNDQSELVRVDTTRAALEIYKLQTMRYFRRGFTINYNDPGWALLFRKLSKDPNTKIRSIIARDCPDPAVLLAMAKYSIKNPADDEESADFDHVIANNLARNTKMPPEGMNLLSRHPDEGVRIAVANKTRDPEILKRLVYDKNEYVVLETYETAATLKNIDLPLREIHLIEISTDVVKYRYRLKHPMTKSIMIEGNRYSKKEVIPWIDTFETDADYKSFLIATGLEEGPQIASGKEHSTHALKGSFTVTMMGGTREQFRKFGEQKGLTKGSWPWGDYERTIYYTPGTIFMLHPDLDKQMIQPRR